MDPVYRIIHWKSYQYKLYERLFTLEEIGFQYGRIDRLSSIFGYIDWIEEENEDDGVVAFEENILSGKDLRFSESLPRFSFFDFTIVIIIVFLLQ